MEQQEYYLVEAARYYGLTQACVTDLVKTIPIPYTRCKRNGKGKLLDHKGMKMLGRAVGKPFPYVLPKAKATATATAKTPVKS